MPSITAIIQRQMPEILQSFSASISEPSRKIEEFRTEKCGPGNSWLFNFEPGSNIARRSVSAIDGGRTSQKLALGDLIIVGATLGESPWSGHLYPDANDIPAEAYAGIIAHSAESQKVEESMMSMLELRIFARSATDFKIIDGAYLGNATQVLFGLTGPASTANLLLDRERAHGDGQLINALNTILQPAHDPEIDVVAVTKSDSSFEYAREALGEHTTISDRVFATRLLKPGEFINPRALISSRRIINAYTKFDLDKMAKKLDKENRELFRELVLGRDLMLRKLDDSRDISKSVLWTTYFKPSKWSEYGQVIRIEFPHFIRSGKNAIDRARELIAVIDQDIRSEQFLEPMSQYNADRNAKDVSLATDMVKSQLIASTSNVRDALGLLRGYRT